MQRLQAEETALLVSIARLSKEKTTLLPRAGCAEAEAAAAVAGDGSVETTGGEVLVGGTGGEKGEGDSPEGFAGEAEMRALLLAKKQSAVEMEREKDRLQTRCRELQVRKRRVRVCECRYLV